MARIKQRVYTKSKERTMQSMLEVCEHTFSEMGMDRKTQYLDKTLIEVQGFPPKGSPLGKKNVITVYKEEDKIFIKLTYDMKDPDQFWDIFETNLAIYGANTEEIEAKAMCVRKICSTIENMGTHIDPEEVWDFLYHYEKNLKKLPEENELNAIAIDYIKMKNELSEDVADADIFVEEEEEEEEEDPDKDNVLVDEETGLVVTKSEALMEMIREIPTLEQDSQNYYISLFDQLTVEDQERLVKKVIAIENDLNKVPYLTDDERAELRKEVRTLDVKKRRKKLSKVIQKREKNKAEYMANFLDGKVRSDLEKLENVNQADIEEIISAILTFSFEEKKNIGNIISEIDLSINKLVSEHGMKYNLPEKKALRMELLRLTPDERQKKLDELLEDFRRNRVEQLLFGEIPQLRFEDNDKLIKEMLWLSKEEVMKKINQMKNDIDKEHKKKSEVFEKSSAGTACPKCAWPMGKFSKKCPRCGYNEDDEWFDL